MSVEGKQIRLDVSGMGIIFHSPESASHIKDGEDYLTSHYTTEQQVQSHIQKGSIVGFGTSSPGTYILHFHDGYPNNDVLQDADYKLRLGLHCIGGVVCVRDLYELLDWLADCPEEQTVPLENGYYHVTLISDQPDSGMIGDNQEIHVFLQQLASFPALSKEGIPTLCF